MASTRICIVSPGVSACFVVTNEGTCTLHSLEKVATYGSGVKVETPAEFRDREWVTCDEAVEEVRRYFLTHGVK